MFNSISFFSYSNLFFALFFSSNFVTWIFVFMSIMAIFTLCFNSHSYSIIINLFFSLICFIYFLSSIYFLFSSLFYCFNYFKSISSLNSTTDDDWVILILEVKILKKLAVIIYFNNKNIDIVINPNPNIFWNSFSLSVKKIYFWNVSVTFFYFIWRSKNEVHKINIF